MKTFLLLLFSMVHCSPLLVFPFSFRLLLPKPAEAAVGVVRGIAALASPRAKL